MENHNINTNVAQIILPPDMELRKIKKPKPKTSSAKKEVLKKLKETLKTFDTALSVASSKNVTIPAELGMLPDNIAEINSVKELKELTSTLESRTQAINQLVAQGGQQQRTNGLFQEGMGGGGGQRIPVGTPYQPQIQPQLLPSGGMFPRPAPPIVPSTTGGVDPSQVPDSDAEKTLEQLRQEILSKLSPEDKAKAEAEMEQAPQTPADPNIPDTPTSPTGSGDVEPVAPTTLYQTDLGFDIGGGKKVNLQSPAGFTDVYREYRQYIESLTSKIVKIDKGVIELPLLEEQQLNRTRNDILDKHDQWLKSLTPDQKQFVDSNTTLSQLDSQLLEITTLDPKDVIKKIAKASGTQIDQITSGITKTEEATTKDATAKRFLNRLDGTKTQFDKIVRIINNNTGLNKDEVIFKQIEDIQQIQVSMDRIYDGLTGPQKVSVENEYQQFRLQSTDLVQGIERMKFEPSSSIITADGKIQRNTTEPDPQTPGSPETPKTPKTPTPGSGDTEPPGLVGPGQEVEPPKKERLIDPTDPQANPPPEDDPTEPDPTDPDDTPPEPGDPKKLTKSGKSVRVPVSKRILSILSDLEAFATNDKSYFTQKRYERLIEILNSSALNKLIDRQVLTIGINDLPPVARKGGKPTGRNAAARKLIQTQILDKVLSKSIPSVITTTKYLPPPPPPPPPPRPFSSDSSNPLEMGFGF